MAVFSNSDHGFSVTGMTTSDVLVEITFESYSGPTGASRYFFDGRYPSNDGASYLYSTAGNNLLQTGNVSSIELDGSPISSLAPADITGGNVLSFVTTGHGGDLVIANRYSLNEPINCEISAVTVKSADGTTTLHTFDLSSPSSTSVPDTTGSATGELLNFTFASVTITDVNTDESVYPGESFVITGTGFGATQGTGGVDIDGVTQTVTAWGDTSITCTAVRGGNEYGTGKTLTVTTDAATTATITVAQEAEPNTFAVTAASPNTTDDASLWTGLVDTVTGDPITIVNGDQAWVKNPNNLTNLAVSADGTITADEEGDFVVQIWLASEGVWGSDQTVTFEVPVSGPVIGTPSARAVGFRNAIRSAARGAVGSSIH